MNVQDIARARTLETRDALAHLEKKIGDLMQQRQVAEDRLKAAGAGISKHRESENDAKRQISEAEGRIAEVQRQLDEIEQKRSALISDLMQLRSSRQQVEEDKRAAHESGQQLELEFRNARDESGRMEEEQRRLENEKARHAKLLQRGLIGAFEEYQAGAFSAVCDAVLGEEARRRRAADLEALQRARHEDPRIADLCDQRDQYAELLKQAKVPAVIEQLRTLSQAVQAQLQDIYPLALALGDQSATHETVADICFYRDATGQIAIVLPIDSATWGQMQEARPGAPVRAASELAWAVAKGLGLKPSDGEFSVGRGYCEYRAVLGDDEATVLAASTVSLPGVRSFQLRFNRLPSEIEEALRDEAANQ